jgi:hypothetical protein
MAQHNVTSTVNKLIAEGYTLEQIKAKADIRTDYNGGWIVWNRTEQSNLQSIGDEKRWAAQEAADKAAEARANNMATDRQVDYIISLLVERIRNGNEDGFMSTHNLYGATGKISKQAVRNLTKTQASNMISSLKGDY